MTGHSFIQVMMVKYGFFVYYVNKMSQGKDVYTIQTSVENLGLCLLILFAYLWAVKLRECMLHLNVLFEELERRHIA